MAVVLVCGVQNSGYQLAYDFLIKAGLARAKPSKREDYSPTDISSGICSAYGLDKNELVSIDQVEPGKVWQALSTDLMLANLSESDWGWADPNLVYMLEHWRDFDPQIKFVLVYSSPDQAVAEMANEGELSTKNVEQALSDWQKINAELIRFYFKNKERCILLNSDFLSRDASLFVNYSRDQLGADLIDIKNNAVAIPKRDPIHDLIAPMLVEDAVDAYALYQELESAADLPGDYIQSETSDSGASSRHNILGPQDDCEKLDPLELALKSWEHFNELKKQGEQKENELSQLETEREEQKKENDLLLSQIDQMQKESEEASKMSKKQIDELEKTLKEQKQKNEKLKQELEKSIAEGDEQKEEGKLLTLQLHQVQEELEQTFIKLQKNENSQNELQAKIGSLTKQREQLEKESDVFKGRLKSLEAEVGKHKANTEKVKDLEAKLDETAQKSEQLGKENGAFKGQLKSLEAEVGKHKANTKKVKGLEAKLDETAQESELQLLQLHQVQEELELYFQKYQEATKREDEQETDSEDDKANVKIEKIIDLRQFVDGDNWHYAEHDGRWAGPEMQSALRIDKIAEGDYRLEVDVVDAMSPDIVRGMKISLNDKPLSLKWQGALASQWAPLAKLLNKTYASQWTPLATLLDKTNLHYPLLITSQAHITSADIKDGLTLSFNFPETISPSTQGSDDFRDLAVRVRKVRFVKK